MESKDEVMQFITQCGYRHVGTFCTNTLHPAVHNISQLWYVFSHYFIKLLWVFFFIYISRFDLETFVKKENLTQHKTASFYDHVIKNRYATDAKTWITHILLKGVHSARKFSVSLHVLFSNVTGLYESIPADALPQSDLLLCTLGDSLPVALSPENMRLHNRPVFWPLVFPLLCLLTLRPNGIK